MMRMTIAFAALLACLAAPYWPGGDRACEDIALAAADLVVAATAGIAVPAGFAAGGLAIAGGTILHVRGLIFDGRKHVVS